MTHGNQTSSNLTKPYLSWHFVSPPIYKHKFPMDPQ